ncbi:TetR/AcrR family transcriptional regulator [Catenulispora yoronensis]|uniref:TetR/AcrR family transcriptional regulator n=1 Tax=Catenulispora yoronensis TaxID=450799 RepID=A0ABP5FG21_9ACTN
MPADPPTEPAADRTADSAADRDPGRSRGPYAKSRRRREEILDAALEVFAQSGYRAGSISEIAERVGMSRAGLLHHFDSKSTLLTAVLEHRDAVSGPLPAEPGQDPGAILRALVALSAYNAEHRGVVELHCVLSAEATTEDHPARAYFASHYARQRDALTQAFATYAAAGRLRTGMEPGAAAAATLAALDGLQTQWLLAPEAVDLPAATARFLGRFVGADHWSGE